MVCPLFYFLLSCLFRFLWLDFWLLTFWPSPSAEEKQGAVFSVFRKRLVVLFDSVSYSLDAVNDRRASYDFGATGQKTLTLATFHSIQQPSYRSTAAIDRGHRETREGEHQNWRFPFSNAKKNRTTMVNHSTFYKSKVTIKLFYTTKGSTFVREGKRWL